MLSKISVRFQSFHQKRFFKKLLRISGQLTSNEASFLYEIAKGIGNDLAIVEIGTYQGKSAIILASAIKATGSNSTVFAVDPHNRYVGPMGGEYGPSDMASLYSNITMFGVGHIVKVIGLDSASASAGWLINNIGLLWIDGDHSFEGVTSDIHSWLPFVKPNGLVAFHDSDYHEVHQAIERARQVHNLRYIQKVDSITLFAKE